ncbi:L-dopachrome tautomerase-related protein [Micromonospora sp. 4G57]|uniref:L-dopachrome tautomerase-related protein n=1 Tax=Micromonospora sicca TaxID=2202420 RepID=A0ABU5J5R0_9ACTN|nr:MULTISPECIES: L-dopachrome tautomerase-related protein [unclassified Micromonospora]MDZ5444935.1 L-dopachrome tautomerase-related protein [Micromonospora sp. 4G57]MDZ5487905.1 L-dopachrome tautomerase-related protein [Micromonospora sp. 4G53]
MLVLPQQEDPRLVPVLSADRVWTGVTTTDDGRVFVSFPSADRPGLQVAEAMPGGRLVPYPDGGWNQAREDHDPIGAFVCANGLRAGPDGRLWIVDAGAPGIGLPAVAGGARLIVIDLGTDTVARIFDLGAVLRETSYLDDVRFNGKIAYITDAGAPGLIVLDLTTGQARRVLDGHPSTIDRRTMHADGQVLRGQGGSELRVHADQLEVSPDGRYLYFQPASGPLARIETRWLDDPSVPDDTLAERVEEWLDTPTTGGTAIDAAGTIYLSDVERRRILTITPDRQVDTLLADPRLIWGDAMWIDASGHLWIPAAQLNRTPGLAAGARSVDYPVWIYKLKIDAGPPANDHT